MYDIVTLGILLGEGDTHRWQSTYVDGLVLSLNICKIKQKGNRLRVPVPPIGPAKVVWCKNLKSKILWDRPFTGIVSLFKWIAGSKFVEYSRKYGWLNPQWEVLVVSNLFEILLKIYIAIKVPAYILVQHNRNSVVSLKHLSCALQTAWEKKIQIVITTCLHVHQALLTPPSFSDKQYEHFKITKTKGCPSWSFLVD